MVGAGLEGRQRCILSSMFWVLRIAIIKIVYLFRTLSENNHPLDARVVLCVEDVVRGVLPPCVAGLQAQVFDLADPVR